MQTKKTRAEIDALKENWRSDPSWDIADTEGFEEHRTELAAYQAEVEAEEAKRRAEAHEKAIARLMKPAIDALPESSEMKELANTHASAINILLRMAAEMLLPLQQALARQAEDLERLRDQLDARITQVQALAVRGGR